MDTVAIVGLGLVGGSFALALRKAGFHGEIVGVSSPAAIEAGLKRGAISRGLTLAEAAKAADLMYLAQPVDRILGTIEILGSMLQTGCLVTDAGSTKAAIVKKAQQYLPATQFLGGHPLAGKEQRGMDAADEDLFSGRPYVLTPDGNEASRAERLKEWLGRMGANIIEMSAEAHDKTVAFTSHIPQVLSTALALTLEREQNDQLRKVFGPGLLDMTRLAMSDAGLWAGILASNEKNVQNGLKSFISILKELQNAIGKPEIAGLFESASEFSGVLRKLPFTS